MEDTHLVRFYRRDGLAGSAGSQFDAPAAAGDGWGAVEGDVLASYVPTAGAVRVGPHGREIRIAGTLFVSPRRMPAGGVGPDTAVQVLEGPTVPPGRFIVVEARLTGDQKFAHEFDLESTAEAFE